MNDTTRHSSYPVELEDTTTPHRDRLSKISIKGYKSLENLELPLENVNVLVGPNGAGKSNFLSFFELLGSMTEDAGLQKYVGSQGGADKLLFNDEKRAGAISCALEFQTNTGTLEYAFTLNQTETNNLALVASSENADAEKIMRKLLQNCAIYQFHDTSKLSPLRMEVDVTDNKILKNHGENLAAVLYDLQKNHPYQYQKVINTIPFTVPLFKNFDLTPTDGKIALRWTQRGTPERTVDARSTSDGTLRFIVLSALLSLPPERTADIILLDEPELGLHPYAIHLIAELIKSAGTQKQIVIATQSPLLLNHFGPEAVMVTSMSDQGATECKRLNKEKLDGWLEAEQMGDLWQSNIFGGNP